MSIDSTIEFVKEEITKFGVKGDESKFYVFRNNTKKDAFNEDKAYFGFIHPEEDPTGAYHDFCVVLFPSDPDKSLPWVLSFGIGSLGFLNDYELASTPGIRRLFQSIISENGVCKTDFSDIKQKLPGEFLDKVPHLAKTLGRYSTVLPACEILEDIESDDSKRKISAFLAIYAKTRGWLRYKVQKKNFEVALKTLRKECVDNSELEVKDLLLERKFVILTGAPGVGKTRLAKIIGNEINAEVLFTQFHAETNYSDFIYGIVPDLTESGLKYTNKFGTFHQSLEYAINNPNKNTLLIVDEINRANLANILGPVFYLFEYQMDEDKSIGIEISPTLKIYALPPNFYMIGTMNTADRSLAVVDFALRRRFAWYELLPTPIVDDSFFLDDFHAFQNIFNWYASSNELSLQPGQGYFLAENESHFLKRVEYELLPLIKEYLQEQLLLTAKEEFNNYFLTRIKKPIFE